MNDAINRQAAIDIAKELTITIEGYEMHNQAVMDYCAEIMRLQPIQHEPKTGYWEPVGVAEVVGGESAMWGSAIAYHKCSECYEQALEENGEEKLSDFCPHCGAKMEGVWMI